ncbi:MAG: DUF1302 domain-containing protein [Pseudomonadaceae bacterium]|jgi:hypothetical protein|nr:DUF1302 domain-containing protein [Pseudomonadaceae bacterium]
MHNNKKSHNLRRGALATAVLAAIWNLPAHAIEVDTGNPDLAVRFDNTIKYNYGVRTESADDRQLGTPNANDGDYNFRKAGTNVTNRLDLLTELDVVFKSSFGFRVSTASWYDKAYDNVGSNSNPYVNGNDATSGILVPRAGAPATGAFGSSHLSNYAQRYYSGPSGEVLDAFVFASTEIGEESLLSGKAGQHNLFWGETLLNPIHSVSYGQSGLDLAKLAASPGTEAKELFRPRNQLSTNFVLNQELSFAAQYFLDWDAARLPEAGTYYGASDAVLNGGQSVLLQHTGTPGLLGQNQFISVRRGHDTTPDKHGDFGLMAKWSPEWLDGTVGAYYRKTSDILPQSVLNGEGLAQSGGVAGVQGLLASGATTSYQLAYADDIDIVGLSLSKNLGGVSVGSDLNVRHNMPLSSITTFVSPYLAAGGTGPLLGSILPPRTAGSGVVADDSNGYGAKGDTLHWTLNGLMTFADTPVFDAATLLGEFYYSRWLSLDDDNAALFKGQDTYRGVDKVTRSNFGVAVNFTPTWYQTFPGVDLSLPLSVNSGLSGVSAVQGGGAKGTGNYAVGVGAAIYNQYFVDLKYVDSFGKTESCVNGQTDGSTPNPLDGEEDYTCTGGGYSSFSGGGAALEDRGAVYLTFKTTI